MIVIIVPGSGSEPQEVLGPFDNPNTANVFLDNLECRRIRKKSLEWEPFLDGWDKNRIIIKEVTSSEKLPPYLRVKPK